MSAGREPSCPSTGILACPLTDDAALPVTLGVPCYANGCRRSAFVCWELLMPRRKSLTAHEVRQKAKLQRQKEERLRRGCGR